MQKYTGSAEGGTPLRAIAGATVTVTTSPGGAIATIYSDNAGTLKANPFTTGTDGEFEFYAANGRYNVTITATGYQDDVKSDILLFDVDDADLSSGGDGTAVWGAISGAISNQTDLSTALAAKADATSTATALNTKADTTAVNTALALKVAYTDIVNNLTSGGTAVPLSAEQGKTLNTALGAKVSTSTIVNDLSSGGTTVPLSAEMGKKLRAGKSWSGSGLPVDANLPGCQDGDDYWRDDFPFVGVAYKRASGVWTVPSSSTTWATLSAMTPSSYTGCVVNVTDWNTDFVSNGTNWIPVAKLLYFETVTLDAADTTAYVAGNGATPVVLATTNTPAGLIIPGCRVEFEGLFGFIGTTASRTAQLDDSSGVPLFQLSPASTVLAVAFKQSLYINDTGFTTNSKAVSLANSVSVADTTTNSTFAPTTWTTDYSTAKTWRWRWIGNAADKAMLCRRSIVIKYK